MIQKTVQFNRENQYHYYQNYNYKNSRFSCFSGNSYNRFNSSNSSNNNNRKNSSYNLQQKKPNFIKSSSLSLRSFVSSKLTIFKRRRSFTNPQNMTEYKSGYIYKLGGVGIFKYRRKYWFVLTRTHILYYTSSEKKSNPIESIALSDIKNIILLQKEPEAIQSTYGFVIEYLTLGSSAPNRLVLQVSPISSLADWVIKIDGITHPDFRSFLAQPDRKLLLKILFKNNIKGGIIKSSDEEEWDYTAIGSLSTIEVTVGKGEKIDYHWDGEWLRSSNHFSSLGTGRFNGVYLAWYLNGVDIKSPNTTTAQPDITYFWDEKEKEYISDRKEFTFKWTRHFLASKYGTGEWIVEGHVPQPVVMFLQLIKYKKRVNNTNEINPFSEHANNIPSTATSSNNINTSSSTTTIVITTGEELTKEAAGGNVRLSIPVNETVAGTLNLPQYIKGEGYLNVSHILFGQQYQSASETQPMVPPASDPSPNDSDDQLSSSLDSNTSDSSSGDNLNVNSTVAEIESSLQKSTTTLEMEGQYISLNFPTSASIESITEIESTEQKPAEKQSDGYSKSRRDTLKLLNDTIFESKKIQSRSSIFDLEKIFNNFKKVSDEEEDEEKEAEKDESNIQLSKVQEIRPIEDTEVVEVIDEEMLVVEIKDEEVEQEDIIDAITSSPSLRQSITTIKIDDDILTIDQDSRPVEIDSLGSSSSSIVEPEELSDEISTASDFSELKVISTPTKSPHRKSSASPTTISFAELRSTSVTPTKESNIMADSFALYVNSPNSILLSPRPTFPSTPLGSVIGPTANECNINSHNHSNNNNNNNNNTVRNFYSKRHPLVKSNSSDHVTTIVENITNSSKQIRQTFCLACNQPIFGHMIIALGSSFHKDCFKCHKCHKELGTKTFYRQGLVQSNSIIDSNNSSNSNSPSISSSSSSISSNNNNVSPLLLDLLSASNESFSLNNSSNNSPLLASKQLLKQQQQQQQQLLPNYLCETCFNDVCPVCPKCHANVMYRCVNALGKKWHTDHFCCLECNQPLVSKSFFEVDGQPYCVDDYNKKFNNNNSNNLNNCNNNNENNIEATLISTTSC